VVLDVPRVGDRAGGDGLHRRRRGAPGKFSLRRARRQRRAREGQVADAASGPIRVMRDVMIEMPDGVRLAANVFLPAEDGRYPGVFTYIPYHKDGIWGTALEGHHRYFAARGYAAMQVDFRGTGGSEGTNPYPMDPQER